MQTHTHVPPFDIEHAEMARYGPPQHEINCDAGDCLYGPPQHELTDADSDWLIAIASSAFRSGYETPLATSFTELEAHKEQQSAEQTEPDERTDNKADNQANTKRVRSRFRI